MSPELADALRRYTQTTERLAKDKRRVQRLEKEAAFAHDLLLKVLRDEEGAEMKEQHDSLPDDPDPSCTADRIGNENPSFGIYGENNHESVPTMP